MSPADAAGTGACLTIDGDGRLVAADPVLDLLNRRAGGGIGLPLALAPVAAVARLARRLDIEVTRAVVVADEGADLELVVRARPDADGVTVAASGWRERAAAGVAGPAEAPVERGDEAARWETDAALRLVRLSAAIAERVGVEPAALLGRPAAALLAFTGESPLDGRAPFAAPAAIVGTGAAVGVEAAVRRDAAGGFAGFVGTLHPLDRRPAEPVGAEPAPLADAFAAGLDRALRRPLAQIVANADSISAATEGPVLPDYAGYAADIAQAGRHLLALIDDLVDLDAVERVDFAPARDAIDLAEVARRAAGLLGVRAGEAGVAIERALPGVTLWARGDYRRALQVLVNLIGNAVRYAPRGSIVLVGLDRWESAVAVTVADEGPGIAAADQARVFDKFARLDPAEPGGSGLGLYIARRLARAMGGDLTLASAAGEGARFTLSLPAG